MKRAGSNDLAKQLWALGDPVRLNILQLLPQSPNCEHGNNVSELAEMLGLSQPTISHHLRVLRQAGFIHGRKMCRDCFYWIDGEQSQAVLDALRAILLTTPNRPPSRKKAPAPKNAPARPPK